MARWAPLGDRSQATSRVDASDRLADLQRTGLTSHRLVPRRPSAGARDGSNPTVDSHQASRLGTVPERMLPDGQVCFAAGCPARVAQPQLVAQG